MEIAIKPSLLVLAAGMGSRYGGLKQMDPMGPHGETLMDYSIYDAAKAGFGKVVFVIRPDFSDAFRKTFESKFTQTISVDYAFQTLDAVPRNFKLPIHRQKPWGTGHAVLAAQKCIHEPFAVINADDYYGQQSFKTMASYLTALNPSSQDSSMVGYTLRQTLSDHGSVSRGVCQSDKHGNLIKIDERKQIEKNGHGAIFKNKGEDVILSGDEIVSMNFWGFSPTILKYFQKQFEEFLTEEGQRESSEFFIPSVVDTLIQREKTHTHVLHSDARWFGVTYPEDKAHVVEEISKLIRQGRYPENLWI